MQSEPFQIVAPLNDQQRGAAQARLDDCPKIMPFTLVQVKSRLVQMTAAVFEDGRTEEEAGLDAPCLTTQDTVAPVLVRPFFATSSALPAVWVRMRNLQFEPSSIGGEAGASKDLATGYRSNILRGAVEWKVQHKSWEAAEQMLDDLTTTLEGGKRFWMPMLGFHDFRVTNVTDMVREEPSPDPTYSASLVASFAGVVAIATRQDSLPLKRISLVLTPQTHGT